MHLGSFRGLRVALRKLPSRFSGIGHLDTDTGMWRRKAKNQ